MNKLPDKLSELIRVGLADLRKVEQDPRYRVNMDCWHQLIGNSCEVCQAGAVMACSLDVPFQTKIGTDDDDS